MTKDEIRADVVNAIVVELIKDMPESILSFYRQLPGRSPLPHSIMVSEILAKLEDESAVCLIRDIVDRSIFSLLYLIDARFKEKNITVLFENGDNIRQHSESSLVDIYRELVSPGGEVLSSFGDTKPV